LQNTFSLTSYYDIKVQYNKKFKYSIEYKIFKFFNKIVRKNDYAVIEIITHLSSYLIHV